MSIRIAAKRSKYGNRRTIVDGITFDSAREAQRYGELKLLQRVGVVEDLQLQKRYALHVNGILIGTYVADFAYRSTRDDAFVVEDAKGVRTRDYKLKKKLMKAIYGVDIVEI